MVTWSALLLPSAVAAVLVFIAGSLIHMVIRWHNSDYRKLANEDSVRVALRSNSPAPGQYTLPYCSDPKAMEDPAMQKRFAEGPNALIYVGPNGVPNMGKLLGLNFAYNFVVSLLAGYVAKATLPAGTPYLDVFQVVGAVAFLAYAGQSPSQSIWMYKPWGVTFKYLLDGLIYGALTAGAFAWLWPAA